MEKFREEYDVIVAGGGVTGCCAALAAARQGVRVALVEQSGQLGGVAACVGRFPWNGFFNYQEDRQIVGGIPWEIIQRLRAEGEEAETHLDPVMESLTDVNGPLLALILSELLREAGAQVWYHCLAEEPLTENGGVKGVYLRHKEGRRLLRCKVLVDATESAELARKAKCEVVHGQEGTGKVQVASTAVMLGNVDMEALIGEIEKEPGQVRPRDFTEEELEYVIRSLRKSSLSCIGTFRRQVEAAKRDGAAMPDREMISGTIYPERRQLISVAVKVAGVDPMDAAGYSWAESEGYRQALVLYRFFRAYIPGCGQARLEGVSCRIGIRETVHIRGEYTLTAEDLIRGTQFEDTIAQGSYIMDIHSPDHGGVDPCTELPTYRIPYRCLLPLGMDGLLVAGRCISATHEAMSGFRVIPIVGAIGQAAGTAAALSCIQKMEPRQIDVGRLQTIILESGGILE